MQHPDGILDLQWQDARPPAEYGEGHFNKTALNSLNAKVVFLVETGHSEALMLHNLLLDFFFFFWYCAHS